MCEYCKQKPWTRTQKEHDYDFDHRLPLDDDYGGYVGLYMGIDKNGKYYLSAIGDDEVRKEINYCPICGRKLN